MTRILLMVQTGGGPVKCASPYLRPCSHWPGPLPARECGACLGTGYSIAIGVARADRWWLVEAENAKHARALIGFKSTGLHGGHIALGSEVRGGRIVASGGKR